jgi:hypothetical protein
MYSVVPNIGVVRLGIDVLKDEAGEALGLATSMLNQTVTSIRSGNSDVKITASGLSV